MRIVPCEYQPKRVAIANPVGFQHRCQHLADEGDRQDDRARSEHRRHQRPRAADRDPPRGLDAERERSGDHRQRRRHHPAVAYQPLDQDGGDQRTDRDDRLGFLASPAVRYIHSSSIVNLGGYVAR